MIQKPLFTGVCTALVTPFFRGQVNYPMLERLLQRQLDAGIRNILICGTTGESPTLSDAEKLEMFRRSKEYVGNQCRIIAGTGSNCTEHGIYLSQAAEQLGVDGLLLVSPYYNKATPEGLFSHYSAIAAAVQIPCILYNVPSRTGTDIPVEIYKKLSRIPNIAGVKEASSDIVKVAGILSECPGFSLWSGNDDQIVPIMSVGGQGVISVLSNVVPAETVEMCNRFFNGDVKGAAQLQFELLDLTHALFSEVNPIPVKAAVSAMGYGENYLRLPLTPMEDANWTKLAAIMRARGIIA